MSTPKNECYFVKYYDKLTEIGKCVWTVRGMWIQTGN